MQQFVVLADITLGMCKDTIPCIRLVNVGYNSANNFVRKNTRYYCGSVSLCHEKFSDMDNL